jgi:hypothetical protein
MLDMVSVLERTGHVKSNRGDTVCFPKGGITVEEAPGQTLDEPFVANEGLLRRQRHRAALMRISVPYGG